MTGIIDGKAVAKEVQKQIKEEVEGLERRWGLAPGLAVVVVGDDPASHIYVRNKEKACKEGQKRPRYSGAIAAATAHSRGKSFRNDFALQRHRWVSPDEPGDADARR